MQSLSRRLYGEKQCGLIAIAYVQCFAAGRVDVVSMPSTE